MNSSELLLLIKTLPTHEDLHFNVKGKSAIILPKAVQQFGILEHGALVTHCRNKQ